MVQPKSQLQLHGHVASQQSTHIMTNVQLVVKRLAKQNSTPTKLIHYACVATFDDEPITPKEVLQKENGKQWKETIDVENNFLFQNKTWDLVELLEGRKTIGCKWVFKMKQKANGEVECYKTRVVAKNSSQIEGVDYEKTFALVARYISIRMLLGIGVMMKTSFLHKKLKEDVYMVQHEGYEKLDYKELVCKLQKTIYGLKQTSWVWNERIDGFLKQKGFK